jgi:hypothetical protein
VTDTARHSVDLRWAGPDASLHRALLASLPRSFAILDADGADVALVSGHAFDGDVIRHLFDEGTRGVMLASPAAASEADLAELVHAAESRGALVVPALRYATLPALQAASADLARDCAAAGLIDGLTSVDPDATAAAAAHAEAALLEALAEQLAILHAFGVRPELELAHRTPDCYLVAGRSGSACVALAAYRSPIDQASLSLDIVGAERRSLLRFDAGAVARPAVVIRSDARGELARPASYFSGFKSSWLRLHDLVASGQDSGVEAFLEELATARSLLV